MSTTDHRRLAELAVDIVAAYASNNSINIIELPTVLQNIHKALVQVAFSNRMETLRKIRKPTSAQILKSITHEGIISFIDGKVYQSLTQHLARHGMNFEEYRKKYDLPSNYPSASSNLASKRSLVAIRAGLRARPIRF